MRGSHETGTALVESDSIRNMGAHRIVGARNEFLIVMNTGLGNDVLVCYVRCVSWVPRCGGSLSGRIAVVWLLVKASRTDHNISLKKCYLLCMYGWGSV